MKTTGFLLASWAAVASAKFFQIEVNTAPDKQVNLVAQLDRLERTHRSVTSGLGASVEEPGVYCQAYSDPNGRDELGEPFWRGKSVVFSQEAGEVVPIGSFMCKDTVEKLRDDGVDDDDDDDDDLDLDDKDKGGDLDGDLQDDDDDDDEYLQGDDDGDFQGDDGDGGDTFKGDDDDDEYIQGDEDDDDLEYDGADYDDDDDAGKDEGAGLNRLKGDDDDDDDDDDFQTEGSGGDERIELKDGEYDEDGDLASGGDDDFEAGLDDGDDDFDAGLDDGDDDDQDDPFLDELDKKASVQFRTSIYNFVRGEVQLGKLVSTKDVKLGSEVVEAVVTRAEGVSISSVSCQLFADAEGKEKLGSPFSILDVRFGRDAVPVMAIKCDVKG
ncbi:hypothetical protein BDBG_05174 [Blastomyces gilchristii SLH14081]|uniref:Uncharacterized protein n=1 Tax=Blastomyces gilchristii (strain SLH14081) TaxID=559298 RepID=A0A179USI0_BLAGS|nr:uncharacterized protein BDBG_05174 [Blastomyces gilchristii SLH14081]OAT09382.1 hypothetical protein BDBG_05174 [Blastomyces gilchristii SLH14081]